MAEDEYWQGQVVRVTGELEDPAQHVVPLGSHGETLTNDPGETLTAFREDNSHATITATANPSTGTYTAEVTADVPGHWEVNDGRGGVYRFFVKPIRQ